MLVGKRAVPAGVGVDLRPVQSDRAHLQNAHLARQLKNLDEQLLDLLQEPPPKRRNRVVVGMIVGRDEPKRHRVVGRPLELPARKHPRRVAVNQQAQQHPGMIRSRPRASIRPAHPAKVETVDHFDDEPRQMLLRKPLVHRRRQQIPSLPIDRPEIVHQKNPPPCANQRLIGKYPPAKPGALGLGPLEAAEGVADAAPRIWSRPRRLVSARGSSARASYLPSLDCECRRGWLPHRARPC